MTKVAFLHCPGCGMGFRHFKSKQEAHHALVKHYKECRKKHPRRR